MSTAKNTQTPVVGLSAGVKEVLASSLTNLGRLHNDEYVLNRHCLESVKDIIRFLRRDNESHEIRRYLGKAKVVQTDLIHIIKTCPPESEDLFDLTVRLLTNLTNSADTVYGNEIPMEKVGRAIYMNLIEHLQDYKEAFRDIDFWNVICTKLTDMFEIDWTERTESQCLRVEKMLVLLRNVLQIPANPEREKIADKDVSIHENVLWSLRQSQILEFLLYLSSNKDEQRYYLHLLEIFSLILKGQNPKLLALSEVQRSACERERDMKELLALREREKLRKSQFRHTRTFDSTLVLEGCKAFSGRDVIYHGSLEDVEKSVVPKDRKSRKPRVFKKPVQSEQVERLSSFSARIFLKEFCIELLNCSYNNLMSVVKEKLLSGKGLPNDETFYFWALRFFLEFNCAYNLDIKLISDSVNVQTFHFLQTNMDENFEKLLCEKKKRSLWVKKLHLILKAYHSLLKTLAWMDSSPDASVRKMSNVLKSQIFYIAEYRDMALVFLIKCDPNTFSIPYMRDVVEVTHLSIKLLEDYTKTNTIVVRKKMKKRTKRGKKKKPKKNFPEPIYEEYNVKWERVKNDVHRALTEETEFPDVAPFDVLLELTDEEQKERAMKNIQKLLHEGKVMDGIGLLRSARQVWPENDHFGSKDMSAEEELTALQEICTAELGNEKIPINISDMEENDEDEEEEEDSETDGECRDYNITEESFDMMSYKRRLVNQKVVEMCSVLLKNYMNNSDYTNHCIMKIFFRIGWECGMPAMMYQASLFWTLLDIANDKYKKYKEINDFTISIFKKFRATAEKNKFTIVELLFWKEPAVALEIQNESDLVDLFDDGNVGKPGAKGRKKTTAEEIEYEADDELERLLGTNKENSADGLNNVVPAAESSDDDADDEAISRLREKNRSFIESQPKKKSKPKKSIPRKRKHKEKHDEETNMDEVVDEVKEVEERLPEAESISGGSDEELQARSVRKLRRIESDDESDVEVPVPRVIDLDKEFDKLLHSQEKSKSENSDEEISIPTRKNSVRLHDSEEEEQLKTNKRPRCIDSDSDGEEKAADTTDKSKKSRVIESNSDSET